MTNRNKKTASNVAGVGCVTLFGLPFALIGIGAGVWVATMFYTAFAVRSWEAVPMRIVSAAVESHRGDDSTTYSVSAQYSYEVNGLTYSGDRVYLDDSSDGFRSVHQRKVDNLNAHRKRGEPVIGHYDPNNPSDSILFREPRMLSFALLILFPGLFTPVGCGLVAGALYAHGMLRDERRLKAQYPDAPWKWRPDWARNEVVTNSKPFAIFWIGVTMLWLALSLPLFFFAGEYMLKGQFLDALPAAPHLVVDSVLIFVTGRSIGRARRYGKASLCLEPMPPKKGETVSITLYTEGALPHQDELTVTLRCERVRTVRKGKNSSTSRDELWSTIKQVPANEIARRGFGSQVALTVQLPPGLPDASNEDSNNKIEWTLTALCETAGYDFSAKFDLPVFGDLEGAEPAAPAETVTVQAEPLTLDPKVVEVSETTSGGLTFHFPRGRFLGASLSMFLFIAIFGGATVALILADDVPVIMPYAFGGTTLILLLIAIQMLTGSVLTTIENGEMRIRRVVLLRPTNKRFAREEIENIKTRRGMRVNERQFYDITVKLTNGKTVKAGTSIPGSHQAEQIATIMTEALRQ